MDFKINPVEGLKGTIEVPGDKSISHRALLLGALAEGKTHVKNFLSAEDCLSTLTCLEKLGVAIEKLSPTELLIEGVGFRGFREPADILNCGNSGTTLRILPGILAGQDFFSVLTGDSSLRKRPMKRIVEPLTQMGAKIWGRDDCNLAPIAIQGGPLQSISHATPVPSAQIKTALLLAALLASGETHIEEKHKSRDHTERMLRFLGAKIDIENNSYRISSGNKLSAGEIDIPGDISSAAFFVIGGLITPNSELSIKNVGINPTRAGLVQLLIDMGANIRQTEDIEKSGEPRADLSIKTTHLRSFQVTEEIVPLIIDELPILAVAATQAEGESVVSGAHELRLKESDRIRAICSELKKFGADITEKPDGFIVNGPTRLRGAVADSFGDHRMAMALAVAGLVADGATTIKNAESVRISFPNFLNLLEEIAV